MHDDTTRRAFLAGTAAALATPWMSAAPAGASAPIYIADMHFHLFFFGPRPASTQPLARNMKSGNATLVSWSLVGDVPWLRPVPGGFKQKGTPEGSEAVRWLGQEMARVKAHIAEQGLKIATTPEDLDRAAAGEPHVLLSVEGATFVDAGLDSLRMAWDLGIRHLQLVHFVDNRIGDFQTEAPRHDGLTDYGRKVVEECNRLGILVDLAHCTDAVVRDALAVSKLPVVWSHSSIQSRPGLRTLTPAWRMRQLPLQTAKEITSRGGVIGLWALGADVGPTPASYADRIAALVAQLGEDHVAFGTDMNALASPALSHFSDLRSAVVHLQQNGMPEARVRKIAMDNYVRVLKLAMRPDAA